MSVRLPSKRRGLAAITSIECADKSSIEDQVFYWGQYLDYLNAFYLVLDSSVLEVDHIAHFNLHELTVRDVFRVTYENGIARGEGVAFESVAAVYQAGRHLSTYQPGLAPEFDSRNFLRHPVSLDAIRRAMSLFDTVMGNAGAHRRLALLAKSLAEYRVGNYDTSIVLAWFITESIVSELWEQQLDNLDRDMEQGRRRINQERRKFLVGRDFTVSIRSNLLELFGVISHDLFSNIDVVRGYRNKIVHSLGFTPKAAEAQRALQTALSTIELQQSLGLRLNFHYSLDSL